MKFKVGDICWDKTDGLDKYKINDIIGYRYYYTIIRENGVEVDHNYPTERFDNECELAYMDIKNTKLAMKINKNRIVKVTHNKITIDLTKEKC